MDKVGPTCGDRRGNRNGSFGPPLGKAALLAAATPDRRQAETLDLWHGDRRFHLTVGEYPDGSPGEVFVHGHTPGSGPYVTLWGVLSDYANHWFSVHTPSEPRNPMNVRFGSLADIQRHTHLGPL